MRLLAAVAGHGALPILRSIVRVNMVDSATCRSCGAVPREGALFCDQCGAHLASTVERAEYKQVTALFVDVVRSMDIAAALDIERLREVMTELVERATAAARRFGGTVEYNGDGIMALFGAPVALEDHAFRACVAALAIQDEVKRLADDVVATDRVSLQVRVGLNSGPVIAGEIGRGTLGYAATGETVGFAQRMEQAAPPGGVMVSESTAHLVEHLTSLADPESVRVKGLAQPVNARRLLAINARDSWFGRAEASLVGRRWEKAALEAIIDRAIAGRGGVVNLVGSPGIGKSRTAREAAAAATARGVEVFWTYCDSHAQDVPFYAVSQLLRAGVRIADLDDEAARARVREEVPDADPQDLLLLDDLLGIADRDVPLPQIDPDARRRRLTALINTASLARAEPALHIIEDVQWIDAVSESMFADLLTVIPQTTLMVLITSRPEYDGMLRRVPGAQAIALAPLGDTDTAALTAELVGPDPSVTDLVGVIADRAAGNPFFAEEMVREFVQRGVLVGQHGKYTCLVDVDDVSVPATVQSAIEARIDRLDRAAKRILNAASVIGLRFTAELLEALGIDLAVDDLVNAELIDQVRFTPSAEYAFHHPLIRAVAYESQLKSDRAELHRRLAAAIQERYPQSLEANAALIAEHLQSAGDLHQAYAWHMRAGTWSTYRDVGAARVSWERALAIADAVSADDPDRTAMRIAPRTMLCGILYRTQMKDAETIFAELRELCGAAGDRASLASAMAGLVLGQAFQGRIRDASRLASEAWALVESIGDPALTVGVSFPLIYPKGHGGEWAAMLQWSQRAIELADGDPTKGDLFIGSPLAVALPTRAMGKYGFGRPGWEDDLRDAISIARSANPFSYVTVVAYVYFPGLPMGAIAATDSAVRENDEALQIAERSGDDMAVSFARAALGLALVNRHTDAERSSGQKVLADACDEFRRRGHNLSELRLLNAYVAGEQARHGDRDEAIRRLFTAVDELTSEGQLLSWGMPATGLLVEALLDRGADGDVHDAETAIERLASAPADDGLVIRDVWLLRLRALLARARGDDAYPNLAARYLAMAESLGYGGHIDWAKAMVDGA